MFVIQSYPLAVAFCVITMLCWGSWATTQKLAGRTGGSSSSTGTTRWACCSCRLLLGLTLGSAGDQGRAFLADLSQAIGRRLLRPCWAG